MRPSNLLSALLLLRATASAWPAGWDPLGIAKREPSLLLPRQDNNDNNNNNNDNNNDDNNDDNNNDNNNNDDQAQSSSAAPSASASANPDNGNNNNDNNNNDDNNNNNNDNNNNNNNDDDKKTTSKYQTTKTYDLRLPAGGVSMITPAAIYGPQYYKIGNNHVTEYVTFAFNFTSLSQTPSRINIAAACATNSQTYPIAMNETIAGKTQTIVWDTGKYQETATEPLLIATYTLMVWDADTSADAMPRAGYLGTYSQLTFGLYEPKAPVPIADFFCATCNGAGALERHTLGFLVGMVVVTVLSFGWFTGVAGLW